jgi:hypothetical protein
MSNVAFDEERDLKVYADQRNGEKIPLLNKLVISTGLAKTVRGSNSILLGIVAICILTMAYLIFFKLLGFGAPQPIRRQTIHLTIPIKKNNPL